MPVEWAQLIRGDTSFESFCDTKDGTRLFAFELGVALREMQSGCTRLDVQFMFACGAGCKQILNCILSCLNQRASLVALASCVYKKRVHA